MPEQLGLQWSTPETKKNAPIIKMSCGIGDTDAFPAFDVDSDAYASKDDTKWGFLVTGGAEFHMPLTVFQVTPDGLADKAGIRLGDIILEINEEDVTQLTLTQAHEKINASPKKIHFLLRNMEEDDQMGQFEAGEEKSIVMRVPKPMPPPSDFHPTPLLGSRCWHPIMWQDPPEPPKPKKKKTKTELDDEGNEVVIELSEDESSDEEEQELPHHRIMRNIRRFFSEVGDNRELRSSTIENMLLALPTASRAK
ncbi:PDZ and LIM domain protein 7 isoform X1 [Drosophila persimilis]|uniref:PDZ and LIM domain protein 7 isoform X3 n=2 Tax=pseudoobscura subgroup TaxID=32358 RepID=A0A6I8USV8_DROPS|nr:PDZ and LIM domain protein 7 isoform X3 [Drosophila pseudoobscura]XP_002015477.2 PDZ and LIM domain protein 7 isoform X1 [Drosophila persimilis]